MINAMIMVTSGRKRSNDYEENKKNNTKINLKQNDNRF